MPGLFAYNHYGQQHETLEMLSQKERALPPVYEPHAAAPNLRDGLSLSDFAAQRR